MVSGKQETLTFKTLTCAVVLKSHTSKGGTQKRTASLVEATRMCITFQRAVNLCMYAKLLYFPSLEFHVDVWTEQWMHKQMQGDYLILTSGVVMCQQIKTSPERLALTREHINSFPRYESHYSTKDNPNRQYLIPPLRLSKMYCLYKDWCAEKGEQYLSEWVYRKIFNSEYNLSFRR